MTYAEVVKKLESLSIMPKSMPGLDKIRQALQHKSWFSKLDSQRIITVAGTNGKGSTCAALQTLLMSANKKVGLYTSPHLVSTTERIRINRTPIAEKEFVELYLANKELIEKHELTHFESLTLMAAEYFFKSNNLDYVIFEVGLGGTYDATNVFPNQIAVITALGLDHQSILGKTIQEIAKNKFGIIKNSSQVIHHKLPDEVINDFKNVIRQTNSESKAAEIGYATAEVAQNPKWILNTKWGSCEINIPGQRAADNIMTALTVFECLGFSPKEHLTSLKKINWLGRMQKINWKNLPAPVYLSGDHNVQGVQSLTDLLRFYKWNKLHLIVGVGYEKDSSQMFDELLKLPRVNLYLTQTPFKGCEVTDYPPQIRAKAIDADNEVLEILNRVKAEPDDIVLVTGSLYLVGKILQHSNY